MYTPEIEMNDANYADNNENNINNEIANINANNDDANVNDNNDDDNNDDVNNDDVNNNMNNNIQMDPTPFYIYVNNLINVGYTKYNSIIIFLNDENIDANYKQIQEVQQELEHGLLLLNN